MKPSLRILFFLSGSQENCYFLKDELNKNGGKWIIRFKKGLSSRIWENLVLAMLGEQFMVGEEICGAVCSVRNKVVNYANVIYYPHLQFSGIYF